MKLTEQQVKNWRLALMQTLGAYALIMTDEQIQAYHDKLQANIEREATEKWSKRNEPTSR